MSIWFNMAKNLSKFGEQQLVMVNYACGFNQWETGKYFEWIIISNYWMRLSRIWRILQIKMGVIHRGQRPRWITPSEICRFFSYPTKAEFNNCFIIHSKYFLVLKGVSPFRSLFYNTTLSPGFLGQRFNNLQRAALLTLFWRHRFNNFRRAALWRHWFNMAKILFKFGEQQLVMVNYACCFNQSETGKYFKWITIIKYSLTLKTAHVAKNMWRIINTKAHSFLRATLSESVRFSEQIMSPDKYPSTLSR